MADAHSLPRGALAGSDRWKTHAYVGYSLICKLPVEMKRVLNVLSAQNNPRATTMIFTAFIGFVFVEPKKSMTVSAFDSWRHRHNLRELDLIVHASADTAAEGLLSSLRPQNDRESCKYFSPASAGKVIHVGLHPSVPSQSVGGVSTGVSTPGVGSATTDHHRSWFPPSIHRTHFVESLTPLLFIRAG